MLINQNSLFSGVKWVFIDLDDTLWDFSSNSDLSLQKLYNHHTILKTTYPDFIEFNNKYHCKNSELWELYHHGHISQDYLKVERFRWLLEHKGYSSDDIMECSWELNDWYLNQLALCSLTIDGAMELLEALSKKFLIGILSNGFIDVQYRKLSSSGLDKYVQRMIISDEIGIQKPDQRIFDYALNEVGATADEVILIGDNPDADIKGAIEAGWKAIYFNRKNKPITQTTPNAVISSLREIIPLI